MNFYLIYLHYLNIDVIIASVRNIFTLHEEDLFYEEHEKESTVAY